MNKLIPIESKASKWDIIFIIIGIIIGIAVLTGLGSMMRCGWICGFSLMG